MRRWQLLMFCCVQFFVAVAQESFPVNGVVDRRNDLFAFTNATIVKDAKTTLQNATMIIRKGIIVYAGTGGTIPKDAVIIDCKGKFIYPSFIDLFSNYGVASTGSGGGGQESFQNLSKTEGAFSWNQALKPETDASKSFKKDADKAKDLRGIGFGLVVSHIQDGIARGSGTLVSLGDRKENIEMIKERAAAFYSFNSGSSSQDYPGSLMGSITLLRQAYLDGQWYKTNPLAEGTNLSIQAWNNNQVLPQIFDAGDKWNDLRAAKIANEFGVQYIIKGGNDEYQRMDDLKAAKISFILPLSFPNAMDVENPDDARVVALSTMKHWEMAPLQTGMFEKAGISFSLSTTGLKNSGDFLSNLKTAIKNGLSKEKALESLTQTPATQIGMYDKTGSLDAGKLANFIICSAPVFNDDAIIFQNWVKGEKYTVNAEGWNDYRGNYKLTVKQGSQNREYNVEVTGKISNPSATIKAANDTLKNDIKLSLNNKLVNITWSLKADSSKLNRLTGVAGEKAWMGNGFSANGESVSWNMQYVSSYVEKPDTSKKEDKKAPINTTMMYPFKGYGWTTAPVQEDLLITNATVWTNEKDGILQNTDVLIKNGKIAAIGKNLKSPGAKVIDGTGKQVTAGIIDEHSHIAVAGGVNECSQSVTAEVRIADVIDPDDINIYRQLSGGVTTSHLLHGSCNTIGGQTQLIKLRWGRNAEDMKFAGWDGFIKFALGENVKRSWNSRNQNRFPDSRMGVEQIITDAFQRAKDYMAMGTNKHKDLELEALAEILNKKRFITCHSYVQSEINMLLHVADQYGFKVNTFTHILEGYKVADKMKAHGAAASTFSDWWAYKYEVYDAIPYNMAIMQKEGLIVAVNSDDAEMARRLNQEAAKSIRYGSLAEEDAFKICTLNPATMLHVADRVGSIKTGKDADIVIWSDNPLSIYAKAEKTIVDGIIYFDRDKDAQMRIAIAAERNRLIQKMIAAKKDGAKTDPATLSFDQVNECELDHKHNNTIWHTDEIIQQ